MSISHIQQREGPAWPPAQPDYPTQYLARRTQLVPWTMPAFGAHALPAVPVLSCSMSPYVWVLGKCMGQCSLQSAAADACKDAGELMPHMQPAPCLHLASSALAPSPYFACTLHMISLAWTLSCPCLPTPCLYPACPCHHLASRLLVPCLPQPFTASLLLAPAQNVDTRGLSHGFSLPTPPCIMHEP